MWEFLTSEIICLHKHFYNFENNIAIVFFYMYKLCQYTLKKNIFGILWVVPVFFIMASKGPLPPVYNPERRFDLFEIELELWAAATTIDKDKQGITIALSLPDDDKLHLRSTVLDKIDKKKLKSADGLDFRIIWMSGSRGRT